MLNSKAGSQPVNTESSWPLHACCFKTFILESGVKTISYIIVKWPEIVVKSAPCPYRRESCNEGITASGRRNKDVIGVKQWYSHRNCRTKTLGTTGTEVASLFKLFFCKLLKRKPACEQSITFVITAWVRSAAVSDGGSCGRDCCSLAELIRYCRGYSSFPPSCWGMNVSLGCCHADDTWFLPPAAAAYPAGLPWGVFPSSQRSPVSSVSFLPLHLEHLQPVCIAASGLEGTPAGRCTKEQS